MNKKRVIRRGRIEQPKDEIKVSFEDAFEYFLTAKKSEGLREKTIISHKEHYDFFVNWLKKAHVDIKYIDEISAPLVREYIVFMKDERYNYKKKEIGLAPQTINARIRFLKNFYNLLNKEQMIDSNVLDQIKFLKTDETPFELLTQDEMHSLLSMPDHAFYPQYRDYVMMMLLYDSGMRISEAVNLEISEVDSASKRIVLPAHKIKTRKPKVIPLSSEIIRLLNGLIEENKGYFGEEKTQIFLTWMGESLKEDTFRRNLKRYVQKAGITKSFSCHDFRRQYCTEFLDSGGSLFALQAIVGHSEISTTRKYVRFDEEMIKNQHELYSPVAKLRKGKKK
ncbi:tyrosine-type recombinase/integrase [Peribacillus loiseleuriae]|uniref:Integrase n=1 Tax=Peribacillus loiseleuriae TaxID=1679170 RepID=A0A0K9GV90_9BACI|nr:tyrosine-type recombinase/integrase [Peribacillus loiseleuriae]KMY50560.1 hypothetical protein AC625_14460 [Peribacillus loiseleuriae]